MPQAREESVERASRRRPSSGQRVLLSALEMDIECAADPPVESGKPSLRGRCEFDGVDPAQRSRVRQGELDPVSAGRFFHDAGEDSVHTENAPGLRRIRNRGGRHAFPRHDPELGVEPRDISHSLGKLDAETFRDQRASGPGCFGIQRQNGHAAGFARPVCSKDSANAVVVQRGGNGQGPEDGGERRDTELAAGVTRAGLPQRLEAERAARRDLAERVQ